MVWLLQRNNEINQWVMIGLSGDRGDAKTVQNSDHAFATGKSITKVSLWLGTARKYGLYC
ncbi:hypothetical protein Pse7367_3802 (plasmid) [Thalassoporum mexicanum PCC 7367]|nr:hypothetical protein Pse7367_3802 [Pseudanabaena sp. PCC 7367]